MIDLLLQNLGLIIDADGDGKRIRDAILQLAVRGRLVAQEAGDEGARTLLLAAERDRDARVALGELRKERRTFLEGAPPIRAADRRGWISAGLGSIAYIEMGQSPKSDTYNDEEIGLPFFQGKAEFGEDHPRAVQWCSDPKKVAEVGDVLVSVRAPVGPTNLADERCCVGRGLAAVRALAGMPPRFLRLLIQAGEPRLVAAATGTTFIAIGRDDLFNLVCDIPPLAEQHRIVAKVDELMGHAAVVEERHLAASSARVRFRDAALHALAEAEDHEAVSRAWSRIEDHFDDLFTEPEDIQPLRQTILQLAVRGRLVAQEAGDGDAGSVLDAVAKQREGLVSRGELKQPRFKSVPEDCEGPFSLATGWVWAPLEHVCLDVSDGVHKTPTYVDSGVPFLSIKDLSGGEISFSDCRYITREAYEDMIRRSRPMPGDILFCRIGTLGNPVVIDTAQEFGIFVSLGLLKAASGVSSQYLRAVLDSPYAYATYEQVKAGGSHASKLNLGSMRELPIPLPPLAEQHRIVAKVDELMALCDTLETSLARAKTTREQFAASISHALTTPDAVPA